MVRVCTGGQLEVNNSRITHPGQTRGAGATTHYPRPHVAVVGPVAPKAINGRIWLDTSATGTGGTGLLGRTTTTVDLTLTTSYTVVLCDASLWPLIMRLPAASANGGRLYYIKKVDSSPNTVTIDGDGLDTIDDGLTAVLTVQYESITINADSVEDNWDIL